MEAAVEVPQEQINAVLGEDPAAFEALIMHLMSPDNYQRGQAEGLFNACKEQRPDALTLKLVHVLKSRGNVGIREMAAVLLRVLFTGQINIWSRISETEVKRDLLVCVEREEVKTVVKKLCDTVAELDALFKEEDPWTDLRLSMLKSVTSITNLNAQVNLLPGLLMYAHLPRDTDLNAQVSMLPQYFRRCLSRGESHDVGIAALKATVNCSFVRELLPCMMEMINHNEEVTAQMAFESFIELASTEPLVLLSSVDVIDSMLEIAEAPEWRRHLALEFIITLFEEIELERIAEVWFFDKLFTILMEMLLDIEDDPDWHAPNTEDEDAGESSNYNVGRQCLYRLAISKGDTIIMPAFYLLRGYLADSDWRKRHAAFITLAKIAEGCADMGSRRNRWIIRQQGIREKVLRMVLHSFQTFSHPRVRWAAINAISQLSKDPDSDLLYRQQVLHALAGAMDDSQNPKVQVSALKILSNMSKEGLPRDILKLYLVGILDKLIHLLKNKNWMVQKAALAALEAFNDLSRPEGLTWCWMLTSFWTPPPPPPPKRDGYLFYA